MTGKSFKKSLWKIKYRLYSTVVSFLLLLIIYADTFGVSNTLISDTEFILDTKDQSIAHVKVSPIPKTKGGAKNKLAFILYKGNERKDIDGEGNLMEGNSSNAFEFEKAHIDPENQIFVSDSNQKSPSLSDLIPAPANPQFKNLVKYPKYNIEAPIIYTTSKDQYQTDSSGNFILDKNGRRKIIENYGSPDSPIQLKLRDGVVHMYFTPQPGEMSGSGSSSSYIVGHSSNYSYVPSAYNEIFKPIERTSKIGEIFYVYDKDGRELKFKVFETLVIEAEDTETAYKSFEGRRVVTLQTSIFRSPQRIDRWLTRGELILPEGVEDF
jgi:hypothetical protein